MGMANRPVESARLGADFGKLWVAGTVSGLGDGVTQIAGALLAASLTSDPLLVSGVLAAQVLPWLVFGLPAGALVDRMDRRRVMVAACSVRAVAIAILGTAVATDSAGLPLLYGVFFLVGCAGLLFDNASATAVPLVVEHSQLERANGRMQATRVVSEQLLSKPLGGWLFAVAAWSPFLIDAGALVLIAGVAATLPSTLGRAVATPAVPIRAAVAEGARWLRRNRLLRTVTFTVGLSNVGLGAVLSTMVLIAHERLQLGSTGYGVLLAVSAVGGVLGGVFTGRIVAAIGPGTALRVGLLIEMIVYVGLATTHSAVVAALVLLPLTAHLAVFSAIGAALRQTLTPPALLGRVHSVYRLVGTSGLFLGAVVGGVLAKQFGLTAPLWLGLGCAIVFTAAAWPILNNRAIQAAREAVAEPEPVADQAPDV